VSSRGSRFWRIILDDGTILYTYSPNIAGEISEGMEFEFDIKTMGRYSHIQGVLPVTDVNDDFPYGHNVGEEPRPSYDKEGRIPSPVGQKNRNASFALSYAKDLAVAVITTSGGKVVPTEEEICQQAKIFLDFLDNA